MSDRIFKLGHETMKGSDVKAWQADLEKAFKKMAIKVHIEQDGVYGPATRAYTAALAHANGMTASKVMAKGVTPELRTQLRNAPGSLTPSQRKVRDSKARMAYRVKLRKQYAVTFGGDVHKPVTVIIEDSWGYHPGVHDGLDVICPGDATLFAMCDAKVIDVRRGPPADRGWWGLGAPSNQALKAKGDGIIQLEVTKTVGPFKKGMHIGYGHAEKATVKVGQHVKAGERIGHAGFANAWHIHLMVNGGGTTKGVGTQDPRPLLDYAVKHSYS